MQRGYLRFALGMAATATLWPGVAAAQEATAQDSAAQGLMALDIGELRGEITNRYDAALALTKDAGVVSADSTQFLWASQAKAQCGIALGFLKSSTKDPVSIGKCADAYERMQMKPPPPPPAPPPPMACNAVPFIVFFDWDRSEITQEAASVLDATVAMLQGCGFPGATISGYTDRSGSDRYNMGLSERRAQAVRNYLGTRGVPDAALNTEGLGESNPRVPTADGVRELQNRRVEINVR